MKVYLVYEGSYSDKHLLGVFDALDGAFSGAAASYRRPWQTHVHQWVEDTAGLPGVIEERRWACEGADSVPTSIAPLRSGCQLAVEEREVHVAVLSTVGGSP